LQIDDLDQAPGPLKIQLAIGSELAPEELGGDAEAGERGFQFVGDRCEKRVAVLFDFR
jgi:hypothetical protein